MNSGGLTIPRDPAEIKNGKIITKDEKDVTIKFNKRAEIVLKVAHQYGYKQGYIKS